MVPWLLRLSLLPLLLLTTACAARFPGEPGPRRHVTVEVTNWSPMDARVVVSADGMGRLGQVFVGALGRAKVRLFRGAASRLSFEAQPVGTLSTHRLGSIVLGDAATVVVEIPARWTDAAVLMLR